MGRKRRELRDPKKRILILCEGETEEAYFKGLLRSKQFKGKVALEIDAPKDQDAINLVERAVQKKKEGKRDRNPYEHIWVVFDRDLHCDQGKAIQRTEKEGISVAFSSLAFEYWYLLHFKKTTKTFTDQDELMAALREHWPAYEKTGQDHFGELEQRLPQAMENAEWLRGRMDEELRDQGGGIHRVNPYLTVDQLVGELVEL